MSMYLQTDIRFEAVADFLSTPLPQDWRDWNLDMRREFWKGDRSSGTLHRKTVSALEIWQELYGHDKRFFSQREARQINRFIRQVPHWLPSTSIDCGPLYGRQRGFSFDGLTEQFEKISGERK